MVRLAIIREQIILEKKHLDFPFQEKMKTMDREAIIQEHKILQIMVRFSISRTD